MLLIVISAAISGFCSDSKPLEIEETLEAKDLADRVPLALSADGKWLAYTLIDPKRRLTERTSGTVEFTQTGVPSEWAYGAIWLAETRGAQITRLTSDQSSSWAPSWSPDGSHLAYYSDQNGTAQLWVWNKEKNKSSTVSTAITRSFFGFEVPQWSSDGKQILVKLLPKEMTLAQAASLLSGEKELPSKTTPETSKITAKVFQSLPSISDASSSSNAWTNEELADLALVDISSGRVQRLLRKEKVRGYWLSSDGGFVAASILKGERAHGSQVVIYDLVLISVKTSQTRVLAHDLVMPYGINVSWSPDGHWLSYVAAGSSLRSESAKIGQCKFVKIPEGDIITPAIDGSSDFTHDYRPPAWNSASSFAFLISGQDIWEIPTKGIGARRLASLPGHQITEFVSSAPGRLAQNKTGSIIVRTYNPESKLRGFYSIELATGTVRKLLEDERWYGRATEGLYDLASTPDSQLIIYGAEDARHPRDLFVTTDEFGSSRRLTSINPQFERHQLGSAIVVDYKDNQGNPLHGALLLPPTHRSGERHPLIIWVYGGASGSPRINRFGLVGSGVENMQLFATRGYAVFFPDAPLSGHSPAADLARTVLPGIHRLNELGVIDPDKIGIMGHSYGGYSVLSLITQSTIFKAAVASASAGDLIGMYGHLSSSGDSFGVGWCEEGQGMMGGTPWQYRERYIDNSPFFFLDKIETPLLLIHGGADETVPPYLSGEMFVGLRRLGKEAVLALYENEDHWEGSWSYPNQVDYLRRVLTWFDSHLATDSKSTPKPIR
ncbi:MAG TPA: prolyl oligopeptidase family serine peptidase [Candidatus Angelobacter sp.]|nr:prolyl oligopeptidase family serine peptidase [Candidatus Angelobacter sp.]